MFLCKAACVVAIIMVHVDVAHLLTPTQDYPFSLQLDGEGKVHLFWNYSDTHITFEIHSRASGYIGFGISPNGKMYPADMVIGWVKENKVHVADYHATEHAAPMKDISQDWHIIHGEENHDGTILKFGRRLDTCDTDDMPIGDQTMRLIYSYHSDDPESEEDIQYHGFSSRGTKSVSLLNSNIAPASLQSEEVKTLDFRNRNYQIPTKHTTYLCTGFQVPKLNGKHHIIKFEPIFTPGSEQYVHHIDILKCRGSYPHLDKKTAECLEDWPEVWPSCPDNLLAWGTGGGSFYFPSHVGYSIGDKDDAVFYVMQLHYNNPFGHEGIIDSSGIRLSITPNLRQYDVTNIMLGHAVTDLQVIPPNESAYVNRAYCSKECVATTLQDANVTEIKAIAAFQHAHLLGVGITTRHFRNGTELPAIIHDPYYDFFFQEVRQLKHEVTIKQGDSFIVECTYNSSKRANATFGGASTNNEMCLSYIYVYPKIPLMACVSTPTYDTIGNADFEPRVKIKRMDWSNPAVKREFEQMLSNSSILHVCERLQGGISKVNTTRFTESERAPYFIADKDNCMH